VTSASLRAARIDPALVRLLDQHGPRYTSYPTALEFHSGVGEAQYLEHLARADAQAPGAAVSLYVHIPFCERHCTFCACHVIATPRRDVAALYLAALEREVALLAERLPRRRSLAQMHWGGGTPTYLTPEEIESLFAAVTARFAIEPAAELAIEIDPRVTTPRHLETLAALGFNRLSLGVQDFTAEVQEAIGRDQTFEQTRSVLALARRLGFAEGINIDLVYGLPRQSAAAFSTTLDRLIELRPERVAMYSFAYVPWSRANQKRIDAPQLPGAEAKLELHLLALERLLAAGYEPIGIDHFALPGDELARASREGRLDRNFMGYTVRGSTVTIAAGASGIAELEGAYFQNERTLAAYHAALDARRLPIQRGYVLDADDRARQHVIRQLLCNFAVDRRDVERRFAIDFDENFADALAGLTTLREHDLLHDDGRRLRMTEPGRLFVRNACMAFDRYLGEKLAGGRRAYSRTV
jgi:oxygen-independent coproporphyrinogen-3 oxidase